MLAQMHILSMTTIPYYELPMFKAGYFSEGGSFTKIDDPILSFLLPLPYNNNLNGFIEVNLIVSPIKYLHNPPLVEITSA